MQCLSRTRLYDRRRERTDTKNAMFVTLPSHLLLVHIRNFQCFLRIVSMVFKFRKKFFPEFQNFKVNYTHINRTLFALLFLKWNTDKLYSFVKAQEVFKLLIFIFNSEDGWGGGQKRLADLSPKCEAILNIENRLKWTLQELKLMQSIV